MPLPCRKRFRAARALTVGAVLISAGAAAGQNSWVFDIQYSDPAGVINSLDDTATVYLWAAFDPQMHAFHKGELSVIADDPIDHGVWSDPEAILIFNGPGTDAGDIEGEKIAGIVVTQLDAFPPDIFADTNNPIRVWKATWQASVLHPRSVSVFTETSAFWLYVNDIGTTKDFADSTTEGQGTIVVVPAPAGSLTLLAVGAARRARRPRSVRRVD